MTAFQFSDYKLALRQMTEARRKQFGTRFTFEKVAESAGIQKAYLSRTLSGDGNLNADQLYAACQFLKLKDAEIDYLLLLREFATATNASRKTKISTEIEKQKAKSQKTEVALSIPTDRKLQQWTWEYYTDPDIHLVHIFLTVPIFASEPELIALKLGLSGDRLQNILLRLQEWGLIRFEKGKYIAGPRTQHLSEDSPIFPSFASSQRVRCLQRARSPHKDNDFFFTVVFSAEPKNRSKLRRDLLAVLDSAKNDITNANSEDVFQLNIDLMQWS